MRKCKIVIFCFLLLIAERDLVEQQLQILDQVDSMCMPSGKVHDVHESVEKLRAFINHWISLDKYVKGDRYALDRMLVHFQFSFS